MDLGILIEAKGSRGLALADAAHTSELDEDVFTVVSWRQRMTTACPML